MPIIESVYTQEITSGGGTINLPVSESYTLYRFYTSGTVVAAGNWTIQSSGTPVLGTTYRILFDGTLTLGSNTLTIFGLSVPDTVATEDFEIIASYDGSAWKTKVLMDFEDIPYISTEMIEDTAITTDKITDLNITTGKIADSGVTTAKIANSNVTTAKIADANITAAKLDSTTKKEIVMIPVSFESGEQGNNSFIIPYDFSIDTIRYDIKKVMAGTDAGTITPTINGLGTTPSSISIAASTAVDTAASTTLTADNTGTAGQVVILDTAKVTAGGKALLTITISRR